MKKGKTTTKFRTDYTGVKQGLITVTGYSHSIIYKTVDETKPSFGRKNTVTVWHYKCECGNTGLIKSSRLRGNQYSCGCQRGGKGLKRGQKQIVPPKYIRKPWTKTGMQDMRAVYRRRAKKKKLPFILSGEQFWELTQSNCYYCNGEPSQKLSAIKTGYKWIEEFIYNGLDRVDSSKGYIISNIVPCCKKCNYAKNDMSQKEFFEHLQKIIKNVQDKKLDHII